MNSSSGLNHYHHPSFMSPATAIAMDKKPSSASLGTAADLRALLHGPHTASHSHSQSAAASRTASLSGMSILLLPVAPIGGDSLLPVAPTPCQQQQHYNVIDRLTLALCGLGAGLAVVGAATTHNNGDVSWREALTANFQEPHKSVDEELHSVRTLNIACAVAGLASLVAGLCKLERQPRSYSRQRLCHVLFVSMLIASFVCSLVSVALWADLIAHGRVMLGARRGPVRQVADINEGQQQQQTGVAGSTAEALEFGWAYWVTVAAAVVLLCANVCHLIRRDCKQRPSGGRLGDRVGEDDEGLKLMRR